MNNRYLKWRSSVLWLALQMLIYGGVSAQQAAGPKPADILPGKILVKYDRNATGSYKGKAVRAELAAQEVLASLNARVSRKIGNDGLEVWQVTDTDRALRMARTIPGAWAIPNYILRLPEVRRLTGPPPMPASPGQASEAMPVPTNDPLLPAQWALGDTAAGIRAQQMWAVLDEAVSAPGDTVYVVVMDSGVDKNHPDLKPNVVPNAAGWNYDAVNDSGDPVDEEGHGTHVAGIVGAAANNGIGVAGVARKVKIIDIRVLGAEGWGSMEMILAGFEHLHHLVTDLDVPVAAVNMSFGGYLPFDQEVRQLLRSVEFMARMQANFGTTWIVAAGNASQDIDTLPVFSWPGDLEGGNIVSVGSITEEGTPSGFTNYGSATVDIGAPGSDILSTIPVWMDDEFPYAALSGTSMAAPQVTGWAALRAAYRPGEHALDRVNALLTGGTGDAAYDDLWMTEARLNGFQSLAPDSSSLADAVNPVLASRPVRLHLNANDSLGSAVAGVMNRGESVFNVTGASLSGPDAARFSLVQRTFPKPLTPGSSFGLEVRFRRDGMNSKAFYSAQITITTSAGDVQIPVTGVQQEYALIRLDPAFDERTEPVMQGTLLTSDFDILNDGGATLEFRLGQMLMQGRPDGEPKKSAASAAKGVSKAPARVASVLRRLEAAQTAGESRRIQIRKPKGKVAPYNRLAESPGEILVWHDSLNNPSDVAEDWTVQVFAEENTTTWELAQQSAGDYAFLFSDNGTYTADAASVALSPVFDFGDSGIEGIGPVNLYFDYRAQMEQDFDVFGVAVFQNGAFAGWIDATDYMMANDSTLNLAVLPVMGLTGMDDVQFAFIAFSDESVEEGFGALFDNVALTMGEVPAFASVYSGSVAPDGSQPVTASVRTGMLPEGFYVLLTAVSSNAANGTWDIGTEAHVLVFANMMNIDLAVEPSETDLGTLERNRRYETTYEISNSGDVPFDYRAFTGIEGMMTPVKALTRPDAQTAYRFSREAAGRIKRPVSSKKLVSGSRVRALAEKARTTTWRPSRTAAKAAPTGGWRSKILKPSMLAEHRMPVYYEGFENSLSFPAGWDVLDLSDHENGGTVWEVQQLNQMERSESDTVNWSENVAMFGDADTFEFDSLSSTVAYSPLIRLPDYEEGRFTYMELDFASYLEPEFDVFVLVMHVLNPETNEIEDAWIMGSSDDLFSGDREGMRFAGFDLTDFNGIEVFFGFYAMTDESMNFGGFWFDNIMIDSYLAPAWTTPNAGYLEPMEGKDVTLTIDTGRLQPGYYAAHTHYNLFVQGAFPRFDWAQHTAWFGFNNNGPIARNDTLAVHSGDIVPVRAVVESILENDTDPDGDQLWVLHATDPVYGNWKFLTYQDRFFEDGPTHYVAPLNYDGWDRFEYLVTDGFSLDTAVVYLAVAAKPGFVRGAQQQFTVLEDDSLAISSIKLAAGVGGVDRELKVWGRSHSRNLRVMSDGAWMAANRVGFKPEANHWGQNIVTLFVGHAGRALDSMRVTVVVVPVNDPPVAAFKAVQGDNVVTFNNLSNDAADPEGAIVKWSWNFGNGTTSEEAQPVAVYERSGRYTVSLTVTDNGGLSSTVSQEVDVVATAAEGKTTPSVFAIHGNFPNPFNPSTVVKFDLPQAASVTVSVYNALGQLVLQPAAGRTLPAGTHSLQVNAAGLASGLYLYRIEAVGPDGRSFSGYRKMTLMK